MYVECGSIAWRYHIENKAIARYKYAQQIEQRLLVFDLKMTNNHWYLDAFVQIISGVWLNNKGLYHRKDGGWIKCSSLV